MGCSQPHPHGQIWANSFLPNEIARKEENLLAYFQENASNLLVDYAQSEMADGSRTVWKRSTGLLLSLTGQHGRSKPC